MGRGTKPLYKDFHRCEAGAMCLALCSLAEDVVSGRAPEPATAQFGHRRHHDRAPSPPISSTPNTVSGGLLRALLERRSRMPCCWPPPQPSGAPQATRATQYGLGEALRAVGSRRRRRPITIAAALDDHRGVRRGFLPRGLCNTCPDAARPRDHLRARAGVTQALT
jgi:hypothetical protein